MIFVTVGAQMPFDRLVRAVDRWAADHREQEIFAQIGKSSLRTEHMPSTRFLEPDEFRDRVRSASVLVSHAGTGSIISALEHAKPIIIMPRRSDLRETRNDHQLATVRRFENTAGIFVAMDEDELVQRLDDVSSLESPAPLSGRASEELLRTLRSFVFDGTHGARSEQSAEPAISPDQKEARA